MALATVVAGQRQRQMSCWRCLLVALEKAAVEQHERFRCFRIRCFWEEEG